MKTIRRRKPSSDNQGWKRSYKKVETAIQKEYVSWLKEHYDLEIIHVANEGDVKPQYRKQLMAMGIRKGCSDLIYVWPQNILFHELKSSDGSHGKDQKDFQHSVENKGFTYIVTYGLEEAKQVPDKHGFPKLTIRGD